MDASALVCAVPWRPEEGAGSPETGVMEEWNPSPLQNYFLLLSQGVLIFQSSLITVGFVVSTKIRKYTSSWVIINKKIGFGESGYSLCCLYNLRRIEISNSTETSNELTSYVPLFMSGHLNSSEWNFMRYPTVTSL